MWGFQKLSWNCQRLFCDLTIESCLTFEAELIVVMHALEIAQKYLWHPQWLESDYAFGVHSVQFWCASVLWKLCAR